MGYGPRLQVEASSFADPEVRSRWHEKRGLEVFSLVSDRHPETTVDLFAREPFDFREEYERAMEAELAPGLPVRFVRLAALIRMKEELGRPRDQDDVVHLREIQDRFGEGE